MTTTKAISKTSSDLTTHAVRQELSYTPIGRNEPIRLTLLMIANDIAVPTASGALPNESDCLRFMHLCEGRKLDPWTGDVFMIGYDSKNGPKFEPITSFQHLLKRAEASPNFAGIESGVVVKTANGLENRVGHIVLDGEVIIGGWAKAHRDDRKVCHESAVQFSTYNTQKSRWNIDPAGMITKVAKAAALREAFPNVVGGLYVEEEMDHVRQAAEEGDHLPEIRREPIPAKITEQPATVDWKALFQQHNVIQQAQLLRDAPTAEDRESILSAASSQVADGTITLQAYDVLSKYAATKN